MLALLDDASVFAVSIFLEFDDYTSATANWLNLTFKWLIAPLTGTFFS